LVTGKQFEIEVQCFFEDERAGKLASHSDGQPIKVQGRVDAQLMMNVLLKDCVVLGKSAPRQDQPTKMKESPLPGLS
jgi:hypothetical protein